MNQKLKRIKQIFVALILIATVEGFSSCEKDSYPPPAVDPNQTWHFQADIQLIFINSKCVTCHNGVTQFPDLRSGKSYASLSSGGYITPPGETSILYHQITTNSAHIPRTTDAQKLEIRYWINQGAHNN
jgi:hypothetical protein